MKSSFRLFNDICDTAAVCNSFCTLYTELGKPNCFFVFLSCFFFFLVLCFSFFSNSGVVRETTSTSKNFIKPCFSIYPRIQMAPLLSLKILSLS